MKHVAAVNKKYLKIRKHFLKYLSLGIADPQKLDGVLEKFAAKLVLQGSTVKIVSTDGLHWGP